MLSVSSQALKGLLPLLKNACTSLCTVSRPVPAPALRKSAECYSFTCRTIHCLAERMATVPHSVTVSGMCRRAAASTQHWGCQQHSPLHTGYDGKDEPPLTEEEKLLLVQTEFQLYKENDLEEIPSNISSDNLADLATINSTNGRLKFLRYLYTIELKSLSMKEKGESRRMHSIQHRKMLKEELAANPDHISYGLWRNSFFIKWDNSRMDYTHNNRLVSANLYGQHIAFDHSFGNYMNLQERKALSKQICECVAVNRSYLDPFYFHFCNFNPEEKSSREIIRAFPVLMEDKCLVDVHGVNYLDLFPKEKLIYINPDAEVEMTKFDRNAIYVIGAVVDKSAQPPLTMAKAKREGIKIQRFPFERYLDWGHGSKKLPLNQILGILLEMKRSGSWKIAFDRHIAARKLIKKDFGSEENLRQRVKQRQHYTDTYRKGIFRNDH